MGNPWPAGTAGSTVQLAPPLTVQALLKVRALLPVGREALEDAPPFDVAGQLEHLLDADPARRSERRRSWLAERLRPAGWWYAADADGWPAGW